MTIPGTDDVDESMLVVPMRHEDALVGVITLSKLGLRQFDDDDLRLLSILADQAATAFSRRSQPRRDPAPRGRAAPAARHEQRPVARRWTRSTSPNLMAEHLARAVGADQAQISDWDRGERARADARLLPARARARRSTTTTRSRATR